MPVELSWLLPDHILLAKYSGNVSPEDIHSQYETGLQMSEAHPEHLVHLIVEIAEVKSFPSQLKAYKGSYGEKSKNAGWVIIIGKNRLMHFISSVIGQLMHLSFAYMTTREEALQYILERDRTIPPTKIQTLGLG